MAFSGQLVKSKGPLTAESWKLEPISEPRRLRQVHQSCDYPRQGHKERKINEKIIQQSSLFMKQFSAAHPIYPVQRLFMSWFTAIFRGSPDLWGKNWTQSRCSLGGRRLFPRITALKSQKQILCYHFESLKIGNLLHIVGSLVFLWGHELFWRLWSSIPASVYFAILAF